MTIAIIIFAFATAAMRIGVLPSMKRRRLFFFFFFFLRPFLFLVLGLKTHKLRLFALYVVLHLSLGAPGA